MNTERQVAVLTGASQGIGAGLVRGFLDRGLIETDRRLDAEERPSREGKMDVR